MEKMVETVLGALVCAWLFFPVVMSVVDMVREGRRSK